jgi:hypothetical protein
MRIGFTKLAPNRAAATAKIPGSSMVRLAFDVPSSTASRAIRDSGANVSERSLLIEDAAAMLRVSRRTVYYRIREGRLRTIHTRCGSQRVLVSSIEALLRETRGEGTKPSNGPNGAETETMARNHALAQGSVAPGREGGPGSREVEGPPVPPNGNVGRSNCC